MTVGEQVRVNSPPEFAYGANGLPPVVPSASSVEFEISLLRFQRPNADDAKEKAEDSMSKELSHLGDDLLIDPTKPQA